MGKEHQPRPPQRARSEARLMAARLAHWMDAKERHPDECTPEKLRELVGDVADPAHILGATTEAVERFQSLKADEQTDRYDFTIDRYTVLRDTLTQAFAPELNAPDQAERCERCGTESRDPLVSMAADWGDGAALYAGVCTGCVQEHEAYWAESSERRHDTAGRRASTRARKRHD